MQIRPLTATDAAAAVALWHATGLTRPWNHPDTDFRRAVTGPESAVLGGTDDNGAMIATVMVGHDGHRGWVYYLAVAPEYRRRGIAGQLLRACESWVQARGIPKIQLMVRRDNAAVLGLYEQWGYEASDVVVLGKRF